MANTFVDSQKLLFSNKKVWTGVVISKDGDQLKVKVGESIRLVWGNFLVGSEVFGVEDQVLGKIQKEDPIVVSIN